MATVLEYALLSQDVYINTELCLNSNGLYIPTSKYLKNDWIGLNVIETISKYPKNRTKDFFARLYANRNTKETIIAYRGTVLSKKGDLKADAELTVKKWSPQDEQARSFFQLAKANLAGQKDKQYSCFPSVTGHSLGGYLAQIVGVEFRGTLAVAFNSPGIGGFVDPYVGYIDPRDPFYKKTVFNYCIDADVIHKTGILIGNTYYLKGALICKIALSSAISQLASYHQLPIGDFINPEVITAIYCGADKEHAIQRVIEALQKNTNIANTVISKQAIV